MFRFLGWGALMCTLCLWCASPALVQAQLFPIHMKMMPMGGSFFNQFLKNQRKGFPFPGGKECEEDAHKLCGGMMKRCVGSFGCTTQCLTDHAPKLSAKCAKAHPCYPDIDRFCPHIAPGQNEMLACLKPHQKELTAACLKQHPCLKQAHPHSCKVLDYSGEAPSFLKDISGFLNKLHSGPGPGSFFNSLGHILGQGDDDEPRMRRLGDDDDDDDDDDNGDFPPLRRPVKHKKKKHKFKKHKHIAHKKTHKEEEVSVEERRQLTKDRELLLKEREEIAAERASLAKEKQRAAATATGAKARFEEMPRRVVQVTSSATSTSALLSLPHLLTTVALVWAFIGAR